MREAERKIGIVSPAIARSREEHETATPAHTIDPLAKTKQLLTDGRY